ncbi:MAG: 4'-phosphopantetheinyl transferase family protein [Verrucomicrobiales bacterium]
MTSPLEVHIARIESIHAPASVPCLSPPEEARAQRFHDRTHAATWRAGRAWIRQRLASTLGSAAPDLTITPDPRGRPRVDGAPQGFDANWSHSGPWIALVISRSGPAGVDIEQLRPDLPHQELAPVVCSPGELKALDALAHDTAARHHFLRLWTAKEALMKATGLGAALDPASIEVDLNRSGTAAYLSHPGWSLQWQSSDDWVAAWTWSSP